MICRCLRTACRYSEAKQIAVQTRDLPCSKGRMAIDFCRHGFQLEDRSLAWATSIVGVDVNALVILLIYSFLVSPPLREAFPVPYFSEAFSKSCKTTSNVNVHVTWPAPLSRARYQKQNHSNPVLPSLDLLDDIDRGKWDNQKHRSYSTSEMTRSCCRHCANQGHLLTSPSVIEQAITSALMVPVSYPGIWVNSANSLGCCLACSAEGAVNLIEDIID